MTKGRRLCHDAGPDLVTLLQTRFTRRRQPNVLHADVFDVVRQVTMNHFPEERNLRSASEVGAASAAHSDDEDASSKYSDIGSGESHSAAYADVWSLPLASLPSASAAIEIWLGGIAEVVPPFSEP